MPIEAVKIPQNVYIEDRIVGPLTLRQIIIIALGGGFSYIIFTSLQKTLGSMPLPIAIMAWIPAGIAAIFAMVKVNDLSVTRILLLLLEGTQKPSQRVWANRTGISINIRTSPKPQDQKPVVKAKALAVQSSEQQIEELSAVIDKAWTPSVQEPPTESFIEETPAATVTEKPEVADAQFVLPAEQTIVPTADSKELSDLAVFRDIFPPPPHGNA